MLRRALYFLMFAAVLLAASSCARIGYIQVQLNEEFSLFIGQGAVIEKEGLKIEFIQIMEDSRCPRGVTCVWAGRITCELELTLAGSSHRLILTKLGLTDEYSRETYEGYELDFQVTPYPEADKRIPANAYHLHLIISKPEGSLT